MKAYLFLAVLLISSTVSAKLTMKQMTDLSPQSIYKELKKIYVTSPEALSEIHQLLSTEKDRAYTGIATCSDNNRIFYVPFVVGEMTKTVGPFSDEIVFFNALYKEDGVYKSLEEASEGLREFGGMGVLKIVGSEYKYKIETIYNYQNRNPLVLKAVSQAGYIDGAIILRKIDTQFSHLKNVKYVFQLSVLNENIHLSEVPCIF